MGLAIPLRKDITNDLTSTSRTSLVCIPVAGRVAASLPRRFCPAPGIQLAGNGHAATVKEAQRGYLIAGTARVQAAALSRCALFRLVWNDK